MHLIKILLAAKEVEDAFYVDDGVTGADSVEDPIELHYVTKRALVSDVVTFRLVSLYHPGQDTSAEPVGGEESMGCSCATSNYTSGGASCTSFCLVTFPDAITPRMSKSYPCMQTVGLCWCGVLEG